MFISTSPNMHATSKNSHHTLCCLSFIKNMLRAVMLVPSKRRYSRSSSNEGPPWERRAVGVESVAVRVNQFDTEASKGKVCRQFRDLKSAEPSKVRRLRAKLQKYIGTFFFLRCSSRTTYRHFFFPPLSGFLLAVLSSFRWVLLSRDCPAKWEVWPQSSLLLLLVVSAFS